MNETHDGLERMLRRFRPAAPPRELRPRVLAEAGRRADGQRSHAARDWRVWVFRAAVAAGLVLALCLNFAADQIAQRDAGMIGLGPAVWDEQAEQTAKLLDGDGWGRRYIALGLMASGTGPAGAFNPASFGETQ